MRSARRTPQWFTSATSNCRSSAISPRRCPTARRGDFLRQLARLIGDRDDAGDGDIYRAALAARQDVTPKAKAISGLTGVRLEQDLVEIR
jgi:hypothetical protein